MYTCAHSQTLSLSLHFLPPSYLSYQYLQYTHVHMHIPTDIYVIAIYVISNISDIYTNMSENIIT